MTITRILALLSVIVLLASLPIAVLAQGGDAPPIPPFQVVGKATIDGESAMDGTMVIAMIDGEKAGTGTVMDGKFSVDVMGEQGAMIMFEFMMGEGDEAMMYMTASEPGEVMVGMPGVPKIANLMAQGDGMMVMPASPPPPAPPQSRRCSRSCPSRASRPSSTRRLPRPWPQPWRPCLCPRTARTAATGRMAKTALTAPTDATAPTAPPVLTAPTAPTAPTVPRATPVPPVQPVLRDPVVLPAPRVQAAEAESSPS